MKPTICGGDACFAAAASRDRARRSCRFATALSGADLGHSTLGFGAGSVVAGRDDPGSESTATEPALGGGRALWTRLGS